MLNSASCSGAADAAAHAADAVGRQSAERIEAMARRLRAQGAGAVGEADVDRVAREFAAVLYTQVVKEMQKSLRDDDEDGTARAVQGFVSTYLPQAVAGQPGEPVGRQLRAYLAGRYEEAANDRP